MKPVIGAVAAMRFWFPVTLFVLFVLSIIVVCAENVHGQNDASRNAEEIGEVRGKVDQIARNIDSMPEQLAVLREKQGRTDAKLEALDNKLGWILGLVSAACTAIFGILVNELIKWAKAISHPREVLQ